MRAQSTVAESPVDLVLAALDGGATSRRSIARHADLSDDLASAVIDQLIRGGQLKSESLAFGCPPKGCGDCGAASAARPACLSGGRGTDRPVLVILSRDKPNGQ